MSGKDNLQISRRALLKAMMAGAGGLALTRFPQRFARAQDGPVTITYWHGWTDQWENYVQDIVDQFHAYQDAIRVEPTIVPGSDMLTRLTAAIAANTPPDVVTFFGSNDIPGLAIQGALVPFATVASEEDMAAIEAFFTPAALAGGVFNGELYATSSGFGVLDLAWNKKHATDAGLDAEVGPVSMSDMDTWIDALTIVNSDGTLDRMGLTPFGGGSDYSAWFANFGGKLYDQATDTITANDSRNVAALEWLSSITEKYGVENVLQFQAGLANEREGVLDPFVSERLAMQLIGPWKLGDFQRFASEDFSWGVKLLPPVEGDDSTGGGTWIWGNYQIIPKGAPNPAAAYEFAKWWSGMTSPDVMATVAAWGDTPSTTTGSPAALEVPQIAALFEEYPDYETFFETMNSPHALTTPMIPVATFYADRLVSEVDKALRLEVSAQEALDAVQTAVDNEYANWR